MSEVQETTKSFGVVSVTLVNDDIASRKADAVVAANDHLQMGGSLHAWSHPSAVRLVVGIGSISDRQCAGMQASPP